MSLEFPVVTICGSMRYSERMLEVAGQLTSDGYIVLMPFVADYIGNVPMDDRKRMLDDMHYRKIDMSVSIIVVGEHRGQSTKREIAYAQYHGKEIIEII